MESNILVIPRYLVFVRFIEIPSLDDSEIKKMAEFQALKEVPCQRGEMLLGYRNLGSHREGFSSIMLAILKREIAENMIKEKGLDGYKVEAIRLHSELLYLFLLNRKVVSPDRIELVVHIGEEASEIMVLDKTVLRFSRGFKNSDRFLEEVNQSVLDYKRNKKNPEIEHVIVVYSSGIDLSEIRQHIRDHFNVPVGFFEYQEDFTKLDLGAEIGLLPKKISERQVKARKRQERLATYSLIGFILVLSFSLLFYKIHEKKKFLGRLSAKVAQVQVRTKKLDSLFKKTEAVERHNKRGRFIIEILNQSYNLVPRDIQISTLEYDGEEKVSYKGISSDMSNILSFTKALEKSKYFSDVEVKYATKKKVKGAEVTDFNIQCRIKP